MSNTQPSAGPNPKVLGAVLVGVVILVALGILLAAAGGDDDNVAAVDPDAPLEYGDVTIDGAPLQQAQSSDDDPAVGETPPMFDVGFEGVGTRFVPGESGKPTMLVFLAHWCPHCQRELPLLVELQNDGAFEGIDTYAIATATTPERGNYPPSVWLDEEGWNGVIVYDDADVTLGNAYGLSGFPMSVFLDADGVVVQRLFGEQDAETIEAAVAAAKG